MKAQWWRRLTSFRDRARFDSELADEVQFHIESRADELIAEGIPPADAHAQAHREFGRAARIQEEAREVWRFRWIEELGSDLRYALRSMRQQPGFAAAATLCLALGTGVNTTIFSVATEALLSEPSVTRDGLVSFRVGGNSHSTPRVVRILQEARPLDDIAGYKETQVNWRDGSETRLLHAIAVTPNLFSAAGIPVATGRGIEPGDEHGVVISHRFWRARLGGAADAVGRSLVLNGQPYTIIGILPPRHRTLIGYGYSPDLYTAANMRGGEQDSLAMIGRLPQGVTRKQAIDRITAAAAELDRVDPTPMFKYAQYIEVEPLSGFERLTEGGARPIAAFFLLLMALVGLVLLIACANVSSLLLARALSRSGELAVRMSLGAGRGRIVRQLLAEAMLLACAGTALGLLLSLAITQVLGEWQIPLPVPVRLEAAPPWRLFSYSVLVVAGVTIAAGLLPAWHATRGSLVGAVKQNELRSTGSLRWRNALVVAQLSLCTVLLVTAFLFLRNLGRANELRVGFDLRQTLYVRVNMVAEKYRDPERWRLFTRRTIETLRNVPGVTAAAYATVVPFQDGSTYGGEMWTDVDKRQIRSRVFMNWVSEAYFESIGIPLLSGRDFTPADANAAPSPVVISNNLARTLFGDANPLGRRIYRPRGNQGTEELQVIGVAGDSHHMTLGEERPLALYGWASKGPQDKTTFIVKSEGSPAGMVQPVRDALLQLDPTVSLEVVPLRAAMGVALLPSQAGAMVIGCVGLLAVVLASVGLFGVLNYAVARRTREIGVRVALGAQRSGVLRLVVRDTVVLLGAGAALGTLAAGFATQPLAMFLMPGLRPGDPLNYVTVVGLLAGVAALASIAPALRALRVDPMVALRYE